MRVLRPNGQIIAIICAVLLVVLSAGAYIRHAELYENYIQSNISQILNLPSNNYDETSRQTPLAPIANQDTTSEPIKNPPQQQANYSYTATPGDTYTGLAREAVQEYTSENKIILSDTELLMAESQLALDAGSPMLEIGQVVNIPESSLSNYVGKQEIAPKPTSVTSNDPQKKSDVADFVTTAEYGDSYISIARQAIIQFSITSGESLTEAQIVAAETFLAESAQWPELNESQTVQIKAESLESVISSASSLTAQDQQLWQSYVNT